MLTNKYLWTNNPQKSYISFNYNNSKISREVRLNTGLTCKTQHKLIITCAPKLKAGKTTQWALGVFVTIHLQFAHSLCSLLALARDNNGFRKKWSEKDFHSLIQFWVRIRWNRSLFVLRSRTLLSPDVNVYIYCVLSTMLRVSVAVFLRQRHCSVSHHTWPEKVTNLYVSMSSFENEDDASN